MEQLMSQVFLLLVLLSACSIAEKILMASMQQPSHVKELAHIGEELISRGHEVFIINDETQPLNKDLKKKGFNVLTFSVPKGFMTPYSTKEADLLRRQVFEVGLEGASKLSFLNEVVTNRVEHCQHMMNDTVAIRTLRSSDFSLAVIDCWIVAPCQLILPVFLDIPFVCATGAWNYGTASKSPLLASFIPHPLHPLPNDVMPFWSRALNVVMNLALPSQVFPLSKDTSLLEQYAPQYSSWNEIVEEAMLFIVTRDHLLEWPAPYMPNVVSVPGLGGTPSKPLTDPQLLSIMSSPKGVVVLSFGSTAPLFPYEFLQILLESFSRLPQTIIFKYSGPIPDNTTLPPNVHHFQKWLPQNDIIGHPNTKAFITHCGNNGQYEALYHGVPMVGIPLYAEQPYNCHRAEVHGYGVDLKGWDQFSADDLAAAVQEVIQNPVYAERTRKASRIMKSEAVHPKQKVATAIEHVMEFGGDHLRSGAYQLHWTQIWMLDVIAFLLLTLSLIAWLFYWVLSRLCSRIARQSTKAKEE